MNLLTDYQLVEQGNDFHVVYKRTVVAVVRPMPRQNYSQYELTLTYDPIGVMVVRQPEDALSYIQSNIKEELENLQMRRVELGDLTEAIKANPHGIANRVLREQRHRARIDHDAIRARLEPWCKHEAEYVTLKDIRLTPDLFRLELNGHLHHVHYLGQLIGTVSENDNGTYTFTMNGTPFGDFSSTPNVDELREYVAQLLVDRRLSLFTEEWTRRERELQLIRSEQSFLYNTRDLTEREAKITRLMEELDVLRLAEMHVRMVQA